VERCTFRPATKTQPKRILAEAHRLKPSSKSRYALFIAFLAATFLVIATSAQDSQSAQARSSTPAPPTYPAPTDLKVLPRSLTGQQVHDIMEQWNKDLGVRCGACHGEDPGVVITDGPASTALAEDSKALKEVARLMYTMTEKINDNYIVAVAGSSMPVTCGTCHRGHVGPERFVVAPASGPAPAQTTPAQ
jgi:Photosynthetic reaction centre cytochrome C subunit